MGVYREDSAKISFGGRLKGTSDSASREGRRIRLLKEKSRPVGGVGERYLLEEATVVLSSPTVEGKTLDVGDTVSRLNEENGE